MGDLEERLCGGCDGYVWIVDVAFVCLWKLEIPWATCLLELMMMITMLHASVLFACTFDVNFVRRLRDP